MTVGTDLVRPPVIRTAREWERTVVLVPAVVMLAVGLWGLSRGQSIWRDEVVTYQVAHRSVPEIWRMLGEIDAVHGCYYLLIHAVFAVWDGGLIALRLPSVLAMAGAASAVAAIGRRLVGARTGLLAGLVFPLLPAVQQYAQEGRSYGLVCAAVVISTLLLVRGWQDPSPAAWTGYGAVVLLAALLHEFAVLAVAAHALALLWGRAPRAVRRGWAAAIAFAAMALVPLVWISHLQADQVAWIKTPDWGDVWAPALVTAIGGICACVPEMPGANAPVRLRAVALPLLGLPPAVLLAVSFFDPLYVDRYVMYSYAGLALLLGLALDWAWAQVPFGNVGRTWPALACILPLVVLLADLPVERHLRSPQGRPNDVAAAARAARAMARFGDGVLFIPSARREAALYDPAAFAGLTDVGLAESGPESGTINGVEAGSEQIRAKLLTVRRVVVITDPKPRALSDRDRAKLANLDDIFRPCRMELVHGIQITLYAAAGACG